jgi:hypothetical protein
MKNRLFKKTIILPVIILFFLNGCSTKKKIVSDIPSNEIELSEIELE